MEFEVGDIAYTIDNGEAYECEICILLADGAICVFDNLSYAGNRYGIKGVPYSELYMYTEPQESLMFRQDEIREAYDIRRDEAGYEADEESYSTPSSRKLLSDIDEFFASSHKPKSGPFSSNYYELDYDDGPVDLIEQQDLREMAAHDSYLEHLNETERGRPVKMSHFTSSDEEIYDEYFNEEEQLHLGRGTLNIDDDYNLSEGSILSNTSSIMTNSPVSSRSSGLSNLSGTALLNALTRKNKEYQENRFSSPTVSSEKKKKERVPSSQQPRNQKSTTVVAAPRVAEKKKEEQKPKKNFRVSTKRK